MKRNKTIYSYFLILFLLCSPAGILGAQEAEFVRLNKQYTLHADGSQEFRCDKELKLFTHTAMNSTYGETFVVYNPEFQELKIHSCYTKQSDGTIIQTPANAFVEVLPRFAADAPAYNHLKEMVIVHTGLDLGSTIYLDYSILTKPGYYPELDIDELLQESSPVSRYTLSVSLPESKTLNYIFYAYEKAPIIKSENRMKTYMWEVNRIPASPRMPFLPQNNENKPRLVANTYADGAAASALLKKQSDEAVSLESETYAQFITESAASIEEKINLVHNHVVNNISTVQIPLPYTGFRFRSPDQVIRTAYGTEMEKTNLLCRMLQAIDVPAEVVLRYPATLASTVLGLAPVKQTVVKISVDGKTKYLSATSEREVKPEWRGSTDSFLTWTGAKLAIEAQPAVYNDKREINIDASQAQNGYFVYQLPATKGIDKWNMRSLNSRRSELLELPSAIQDKISYTLTLPEGVTLLTAVQPIEIDTPQGKVCRTIRITGNQIEVVRSIELYKQQYTPQEYNNVRKLIAEWNSENNRQLLFKAN